MIPGIDYFAASLADMAYQIDLAMAGQMWSLHAVLLAITGIINYVASILTRGLLPLVMQVVVNFIQTTGLLSAAMYLALVLVAVSIAASYLEIRIVDLRKVLMYGVLGSILLTSGPTLMSQIELARKTIAASIYSQASASVNSSGDFKWAVGRMSAAPGTEGPLVLSDHYSQDFPGIRAWDAALSALMVSDGEESSGDLPYNFRLAFFKYPGIVSLGPDERVQALREADIGLRRLQMSYPLSAVALLESIVELLFSIAGFVLLTAIPFSLVFAFFLPTESIAFGMIRQYFMLILNYLIINVMNSIGVAALIIAAGRGSLLAAIGGSVFAAIFYVIAIRAGWQMAIGSLTALTSGIAQMVGVREPVSEAIQGVQQTVSLGVGAVGAVAAVAAGAPMLAPAAFQAGQGLTQSQWQSQEEKKSLLRTSLGFAGGALMRGTPLQGPAQGLSMLETLGGEEGIGAMAAKLQTSDAVYAGMTAGSNPMAAMYAMDRAFTRRKRLQGRYSLDDGEGEPDESQPAPHMHAGSARPPQLPHRPPTGPQHTPVPSTSSVSGLPYLMPTMYTPALISPWRQAIDAAIDRNGPAWADRIAQALADAVQKMRADGLGDDQIRRKFVDKNNLPCMGSEGGQALYAALPPEVCRSLVNPTAQAAAAGIIGETLMPKMEITRPMLANAIALAVEEGAEHGAENVAQRLGMSLAALGNAYGPVNAMVARSQELGLTGSHVQQVLSGNVPDAMQSDPAVTQLAMRGAMLPDSFTVIQPRLRETDQ